MLISEVAKLTMVGDGVVVKRIPYGDIGDSREGIIELFSSKHGCLKSLYCKLEIIMQAIVMASIILRFKQTCTNTVN